jgi:pimeloyl-ACP methyl ester carboxylesterase
MHEQKEKTTAYGIYAVVFLIGASILFAAYVYRPKEFTEFQSTYLELNPTQYVELENYNTHYYKAGLGETVILVHGGGGWLYSYQNNINALSEYFEVYALDMPGHGYTTAFHEPVYDLDTYADFIYEFMEIQQIDKISFIGHSWGGGWVTYFATKYPDKVDKLILIAPSGLDDPDKSEWRYLNYPVLGEIMANFISLNATRVSLERMVHDPVFVTEQYAKEIYAPLSRLDNRRAQLLSQRNMDWRITDKGIEELNNYILHIFGDVDPYFDIEYANQIEQRLDSSILVTIKDSGRLRFQSKAQPSIYRLAKPKYVLASFSAVRQSQVSISAV